MNAARLAAGASDKFRRKMSSDLNRTFDELFWRLNDEGFLTREHEQGLDQRDLR